MANMLVAGLILAASTGIAGASETPNAAQDDERVVALVVQLGADDFDARDAASRELAGGPARWLPILHRLAHASNDPEVRCRVYLAIRTVVGDQLVPRLADAKPRTKPIALDALLGSSGLCQPWVAMPGEDRIQHASRVITLRDTWADKVWNGAEIPEDVRTGDAPMLTETVDATVAATAIIEFERLEGLLLPVNGLIFCNDGWITTE